MADATPGPTASAPSVAQIAAATGERLMPPGPGRVFRSSRRVRLSDVDPDGVARLDAVGRYLQDVATDDVRQAGIEEAVAWVVRRTTIVAPRRPAYGEEVEAATWCSGVGPALAERRTRITGDRGAEVEVVSLWVSLDPVTRRPGPVAGEHFEPYREQAGDRRVRSRFLLAQAPSGAAAQAASGAAAPAATGAEANGAGRVWPLRDSDFDLFGHMNNVVAWAAAEEEARRASGGRRPSWGQVEYRRPVEPGETLTLLSRPTDGALDVWLIGADGATAVAARLGWSGPSPLDLERHLA